MVTLSGFTHLECLCDVLPWFAQGAGQCVDRSREYTGSLAWSLSTVVTPPTVRTVQEEKAVQHPSLHPALKATISLPFQPYSPCLPLALHAELRGHSAKEPSST